MIETTTKGFDKVGDDLRDLGKKIANKVSRQALRKIAKMLKADVAEVMPVGETKEAKKSLKVRSGKRKKNEVSISVAAIMDENPHIAPIEYGTKNQAAQSPMRNSFDKDVEAMVEFFINDINEAIGEIKTK